MHPSDRTFDAHAQQPRTVNKSAARIASENPISLLATRRTWSCTSVWSNATPTGENTMTGGRGSSRHRSVPVAAPQKTAVDAGGGCRGRRLASDCFGARFSEQFDLIPYLSCE
jgi:hypothetical protein